MKSSYSKKKSKETYKDPIYGIPHFHDPALCRIIRKHDPSYQVSLSMRQLYIKSQQRLKTVQANRPKYMHTAYNIETLQKSPLICFPHFEEMTEFLTYWFATQERRRSEAKTTTQISTFNAQTKFCKGLFLLLQEAARASPLSPSPLKGIYNWFLQRDSVINQSRTLEPNKENELFFVVEMMNGKKVKVEKSLLDYRRVLEKSLKTPEEIEAMLREIQPDEIQEPPPIIKKVKRNAVRVIKETPPRRHTKRTTTSSSSYGERSLHSGFDYEKFHADMEKQRKDDKVTDDIARVVADKRKQEISQRIGWE
ncbi:hypothetical protein TRFO_35483 [Tritrichomonas foetus]|uniref:Uncharacterized protein n=1 Tax=Tritrichomonas foetus TaxID=1144522 RepID=A0A1J4JFW8_9EUKA|nr:hypothetical protein TRFO_35483 [Tritrichomonas foetus]|eukprot:OHS98118.1 hypothetical protein TRFO_35483 [Tritrichomonas foetus]